MDKTGLIQVLEYGEKVGPGGTTEGEFLIWTKNRAVHEKSSGRDGDAGTGALIAIFHECFEPVPLNGKNDVDNAYRLKAEYRYRLIEYRNMQKGIQTATSASKTAVAAIALSVAAIIISLFTGLNRPDPAVSLSDAEISRIVDTVEKSVSREVRLDGLQMRQILSAIEADKAAAPQKKSAMMPSNEIKHHELINRYFEENQ